MPAPAIAPVAIRLAAYAVVAAAAYLATRRPTDAPLDAGREDALDGAPETGSLETRVGRGEARADAAGRWRRTIRLGRRALEIDLAAIGRARIRTV